MKRRVLSFLLTCIMVIGMLPAAVFADETGNTGTTETPAAPEDSITVEIPVEKTVEVRGEDYDAPAQNFEFEVYIFEEEDDVDLTSSYFGGTIGSALTAVTGNTVATEGADTYNTTVNVTLDKKDFITIGDENKVSGVSLFITEKIADVEGWHFRSDSVYGWVVKVQLTEDGYEIVSYHMALAVDYVMVEPSEVNAASFKNTYTKPTPVIITIPFTKTVVADGTGTVPAETFEFDVKFPYNPQLELGEGDIVASIKTNGADTYNGEITITMTEREFESARNGSFDVVISEKNGGALRWTYSTDKYWIRFPDWSVNSLDESAAPKASISIKPEVEAICVPAIETDNGFVPDGEAEPVAIPAFTNTYTVPEEITIEIPFTKVVELGSNGVPGEETFQFEAIFPFMDTEGTSLEAPVVSVETDGAGEYEDTLVITVSEDDLECLGEGFILREVQGTAAYWEYDETAWYIQRNWNADTAEEPSFVFCKAVYEEAEDATVEGRWIRDVNNPEDEIVFTNTYTREVSRFERDIRILLRSVFDVEASASEGGSISKPGISKVFFKHAIKYTITPAEGYEIEAVYVDGKNVGAVESYIFRDVTKDHTINAVFAAVEG